MPDELPEGATGYQQWQRRQTAYDRGTVATVGMIVAGVGAAAAVTRWAALPGSTPSDSDADDTLEVGVGPSQAQLRGSF